MGRGLLFDGPGHLGAVAIDVDGEEAWALAGLWFGAPHEGPDDFLVAFGDWE